ncbi:MAG: hypothetical protein PHY15_01115 [Eubacteriales bacterium]|nr:hypothetical protein [Eubacteriales bacterium]MDD4474343.1 hypothetical protein [Eubacteriales bacterium]
MKKYLTIALLAIIPMFLMTKADSIKFTAEVTEPPLIYNAYFPLNINVHDSTADFEIYIDKWSGFLKEKCLVIKLESDLRFYFDGEETDTARIFLGQYTGEKYALKIKAVGTDGVHEFTTQVSTEEPSLD